MDLYRKLVLANPDCTHIFINLPAKNFPTEEIEGFMLVFGSSRYIPKIDNKNIQINYSENLLLRNSNSFTIYISFEDGNIKFVYCDMFHEVDIRLWKDFNVDNPIVPEFVNKILKLTHGENWHDTVKIDVEAKISETRNFPINVKKKLM